jgi:ABC-type branched-subunit amino acid transport system ATPase component
MRDSAVAVPCLQLEHVSRHFGGLKAVDDVTLAVAPGARHAVIGPNGAGKTTLFNVISGELAPTQGTISLDGHDVSALKPDRRAALGVSRTFQITRLFAELTVTENALLACAALDRRRFAMFRPLSSYSEFTERAAALLDRFGLSDLAHEQARHISYGASRRLDVALAMAGRPRLLLLDEPMAGLSTPERTAIRALLEEIEPSIAVLLIEHDMDVAFSFASRVTVLHQGKVLADGTRDEVSANAQVQKAYLGGLVDSK